MKDLDSALELAKQMVAIGTGYDRETVAFITNMDQPLGNTVGNALEVKEAIQTLRGEGPQDLYELCLQLGAKLLLLAGRVQSKGDALSLLEETISSESAYRKLFDLVSHQGGDTSYIMNPDLLPKAKHIIDVKSRTGGFVRSLNAERIGKVALDLGAGRNTMDSSIDPAVGIVLNKKIGDKVDIGDTLAYIHSNSIDKAMQARIDIEQIYTIREEYTDPGRLIHAFVTKNGIKLY